MDRVIYQLDRVDSCGSELLGDICRLTHSLLEQDSFDRNEVEQVITNDILERIPNYIYRKYPDIGFYDVMDVITGKSDQYLIVDEDEDGDENVVLKVHMENNDDSTELPANRSDVFSSIVVSIGEAIRCTYYVEEVKNPKYYVIDVLGAPCPGTLFTELILAGPFEKREDAEAQLKAVTKHPYGDYNQTVQVYAIDVNSSESVKGWIETCTEILELENRLDTIEERDHIFRRRNNRDLIYSYLKKLRQHFGLEPEEEGIVDEEDWE